MLPQAPVLLRVLLDSLLPRKKEDEKTDKADEPTADASEGWRTDFERAWCFELASAVLALLVEHVRSPHSAQLWLELHYGLGAATARHRASLATVPPTPTGAVVQEEGAECAAVRRTADLLSQAVGHMGGILLREQAIGVKQAALLAEALSELTSPELFWVPATSPGCRRAVVELLAVALCGLHRHQRLVKAMPRVIRAASAAPHARVETVCGALDTHPALALSRSLLGGFGAERTANKPPPMRVTRAVALPPLLEACAGPLAERSDIALEILLRVIHGTGVGLVLARENNVAVKFGAGPRGGRGDKMQDIDEEDEEAATEDGVDGIGALATIQGASGAGGLPIDAVSGRKVIFRWHDVLIHFFVRPTQW